METFVDPVSRKSVQQIQVAEGETKVVAVRANFDPGDSSRPADVSVACQDLTVALCHQVRKLARPKDSYCVQNHEVYNMAEIDTVWVELTAAGLVPWSRLPSNNLFCFQICGIRSGQTQLTAQFRTKPPNSDPYALPVSVLVTENKKRLLLLPPSDFNVLWANHPLVQNGFSLSGRFPCNNGKDPLPPLGHNQCMVRFCTALAHSGVSLSGLHSGKCGHAGAEHQYHFANPYDFLTWKGSKDARGGLRDGYVWEAAHLQPEPTPGVAAVNFMWLKRGVVLFCNYFNTSEGHDMFGGHIDLWNKWKMGNNCTSDNEPWKQEAAFYRARKIVFWPLE